MAHIGKHLIDFESAVFSVYVGLQESARSDWPKEVTFVSSFQMPPFTERATLKSHVGF